MIRHFGADKIINNNLAIDIFAYTHTLTHSTHTLILILIQITIDRSLKWNLPSPILKEQQNEVAGATGHRSF